MNGGAWFRRMLQEKRLVTLLLMLACGAALILLSYRMTDAQEPQRAQDIAYTEGSMEERLARVLSQINGAGKVDVLVMQDEAGICGVVVVADGAQQLTVRSDLMRAAMTALDVPAQSVEVFQRSAEEVE